MRRNPVMPVFELRNYLGYDAETGNIFWLISPRGGIQAGDVIKTRNSYGYIQVCLQRRPYLGHRVGWALTHNAWPKGMVDHINGMKWDNRLCNLREATGAQNQANRGVRKDSKTGLRGVRFNSKIGKYAAQIQVGGFDTPEEAAAEYLRLAKICYGEFSPSMRPDDERIARILGGQDST